MILARLYNWNKVSEEERAKISNLVERYRAPKFEKFQGKKTNL